MLDLIRPIFQALSFTDALVCPCPRGLHLWFPSPCFPHCPYLSTGPHLQTSLQLGLNAQTILASRHINPTGVAWMANSDEICAAESHIVPSIPGLRGHCSPMSPTPARVAIQGLKASRRGCVCPAATPWICPVRCRRKNSSRAKPLLAYLLKTE